MCAQRKSAPPKKWRHYVWVLAAAAALFLVYKTFGPNTGSMTDGDYLYIRTGARYDAVKNTLLQNGFIKDARSFDLVAHEAGYTQKVRAGKYKITKGMSNFAIVRLLRSGKQTPVRLVINKLRTRQDFISLLAQKLEADSAVLRQMLHDNNYLAQFGLDSNTALCAVMPNTYEFYWNTSADSAFRKLERSYVQFWTAARMAQAQAQGLTPQEAVILASIVSEETEQAAEKPLIASVYLNRLRKGMKLQADPTARFAYGDFAIRRITSVHTQIRSPYNTYQVPGLPPGPICTPTAATIDAVLQAPSNNFLYFCAREDRSGLHRFAATYQEHLKNARAFQQSLDARGIH
jgi:UPF0755 protein